MRIQIYIKDVKSSNGTFINGERLSGEAVESEPWEMKSDDIVVCTFTFSFSLTFLSLSFSFISFESGSMGVVRWAAIMPHGSTRAGGPPSLSFVRLDVLCW